MSYDDFSFRRRPRGRTWRPISDRINRAVSQSLRLLHRDDSLFFILGSTGNVYKVNLSTIPSCTCPDPVRPCKHILFVFILVLGLPDYDDDCLGTLQPHQIQSLLSRPTSARSLASSAVRERFLQMYFQPSGPRSVVVSAAGGSCPVCLEVMKKGEKAVTCSTCKNVVHEKCFLEWKRTCLRRPVTCVVCRAPWGGGSGDYQEKRYMNLSAYMVEADWAVEQEEEEEEDEDEDENEEEEEEEEDEEDEDEDEDEDDEGMEGEDEDVSQPPNQGTTTSTTQPATTPTLQFQTAAPIDSTLEARLEANQKKALEMVAAAQFQMWQVMMANREEDRKQEEERWKRVEERWKQENERRKRKREEDMREREEQRRRDDERWARQVEENHRNIFNLFLMCQQQNQPQGLRAPNPPAAGASSSSTPNGPFKFL